MLTYSGLKTSTALKNGQPYGCYGLLGDGYLQQQALQFLLEQILPPDERDFNQDVLNGESATANELLAITAQLPFIATHRVVIVRNAEKLDGVARGVAGGGTAASEAKNKSEAKAAKALSAGQQLARGLENLPPSTVLILMRTPETPDSWGKAAPRCLNAALDKTIETQGVIINCLVGQKDQAVPMAVIKKEVEQRGLKMEPGAAVHLVQRVGHDIGLLLTELEKCSLRVGAEGTITRQVIDEMTRRKPQETIFDLLDAIGARRTPQALTLLRELLDGGEVPERILATLVSHLRQLWQVRALRDQKVAMNATAINSMPPGLAAQFPDDGIVGRWQQFAWKIKRMEAQAALFSGPQIEAALERTFETDLALKGIENDGGTPELLLERLVMRLGE